MTGIGRKSITTSVAIFGTLMPCQNRGASMQCVENSARFQRAEKGRHDASDVTTPAKALQTMMTPRM